MGGSGGKFDPPTVRSEVRALENAIDDAAYESQVGQLLTTILANANDRNVELIQTHLANIERIIAQEVDGFVDLLVGGSVAKKTYVAGVSDVDALVVLNDSELAAMTPLEVRDHFIERLRGRLPDTTVEPDGFAVAVRYADGLVELVPVKRRGDDYLLPSPDCQTWTRIRPRAFTDALTAANRDHNGKLIPVIKLAKVALTEMPEARRPSGYHLESLALDVFAGYQGPRTPKDMLNHFFTQGSQRVLQPILDRTGQSRHIDDHLGPAMSVERQILSDSLGRIARRLQNADGARALEQWKRVFRDE
jgi:hypothetical protein